MEIPSLAMYDMYYVIAPVSGDCLENNFVMKALEGIIWFSLELPSSGSSIEH